VFNDGAVQGGNPSKLITTFQAPVSEQTLCVSEFGRCRRDTQKGLLLREPGGASAAWPTVPSL
jgi:hypothetical protein